MACDWLFLLGKKNIGSCAAQEIFSTISSGGLPGWYGLQPWRRPALLRDPLKHGIDLTRSVVWRAKSRIDMNFEPESRARPIME